MAGDRDLSENDHLKDDNWNLRNDRDYQEGIQSDMIREGPGEHQLLRGCQENLPKATKKNG